MDGWMDVGMYVCMLCLYECMHVCKYVCIYVCTCRVNPPMTAAMPKITEEITAAVICPEVLDASW